MATVVREIVVDASPESVWAIVGDFESGPMRMSGGALTGSRMVRPDVRELTFADGTTARERLVGRDEGARRLAYAWIGDEVRHDNTSMQVFALDDGRSRLVWTHDTLPDELTDWLAATMDRTAPLLRRHLAAG
ncbi:SRPBCC family protein [Krasilnikoviella flava]|uniref:Polyketide cyclase / dehydrase and lipid transport n=1 Tax=Krasilnikoviella flava TaxID=526729 RepID=A0A1T5LA47_9MICO|nr:SRPBCC family protein [Krasilnikoviella flava]SKC72539.1 Polyketide cyclase / dehydrase and lipid transport [Krasilnikoviella flava]